MTIDELKTLLDSGRSDQIDQVIEHLIVLLTSDDGQERGWGYTLLQEGLNEALYQSCLNYTALVGGPTSPLLKVVARTVEFWAIRRPSGEF